MALWVTVRFYNLLRIGVTWNGQEVIELWYIPSNSSTISIAKYKSYREGYLHDEETNDESVGGTDTSHSFSNIASSTKFICEKMDRGAFKGMRRKRDQNLHPNKCKHHQVVSTKYYTSTDYGDSDDDNVGSGSDAEDSFLVTYDSNSITSIWGYSKYYINDILNWWFWTLDVTEKNDKRFFFKNRLKSFKAVYLKQYANQIYIGEHSSQSVVLDGVFVVRRFLYKEYWGYDANPYCLAKYFFSHIALSIHLIKFSKNVDSCFFLSRWNQQFFALKPN